MELPSFPQLGLDNVLKNKRQATAEAKQSATEAALTVSLKKRSRTRETDPDLVAGLARVIKSNVYTDAVVDLLHTHMDGGRGATEG
jgi:hypothetical protein